MVTSVEWINVFFVPVIALWYYYKRHERIPDPSIKLLLQYAILASFNIVLTKVETFLIKILLGKEIFIDSGYYTLLAIVAAVALPMLLDWAVGTYADRKVLLEKGKNLLIKREMKYSQKLFVSLLLIALIVIAYVIRGPLEIYAGNTHEFVFTLCDFLPWILAICAIILVMIGCLLALLPDEPFRLVSVILLWFGVASWIQDLFLNKKLAEANGGPMDWASLGLLPRNNALVWIVLLAVAIFLYIRFKQIWFSLTKILAGALCLVQLVAIGSVLLTMAERGPKQQQLFISGENQMKMASEENFIVFLLDSVSAAEIPMMLERYPDSVEIMKDFTFYNNACCDYYRTFPSVTHMLTGNELEVDITAEEWMERSWGSNRCVQFYSYLQENGFKREIYEDVAGIGYVYGSIENLVGRFDNIKQIQMQTNRTLLLQNLLKLSMYRGLPYICKPPFEVLTTEFSEIVLPEDETEWSTYTHWDYYQKLKEVKLSIDSQTKKQFVFQHFPGVHVPFRTTDQATYTENGDLISTLRGVFRILQEYFNQMKQLGIYENSTIIVLSDHGQESPTLLAPIFYLKRPGETHKQTKINSAPISHQDFQATVLELIGCNDGNFGTSIFDWKPGQERRRILYIWGFDKDRPDVRGSTWNCYHGYVYYRDFEELCERRQGDPDLIIPSNEWETAQ